MKRATVVLLACVLAAQAQAWPWSPKSYAECILDKMPGTQNVTVLVVNGQVCAREFPARFDTTDDQDFPRVPGRTDECIIKYAKNTPNQQAAWWILSACVHLHGPRQ